MDTLLHREIQQRRPFANLGELVFLNLVRTTEALARRESELLKSRDLSFAQYNVLRILRGAGDDGLSCGEISERMVKRDPDVTRLLDRLVARGLVTRGRREDDRRVVITHVTAEGRALLNEVDAPLAEVHRDQTAHMDAAELERLVELLERLRTPA
jgi:DNA-binding MarR family transcriptional regulator